jgi:hypothetical protein
MDPFGAFKTALTAPYHAAQAAINWDAHIEHGVNQHLELSNRFVKEGMHPFDAQQLAGKIVYGNYAHDPALQAHYLQVMQKAGVIPYQAR